MSEPRVKRHPYFSMIDWSHVYFKRYIPPYIPPVDPSNALDTQNFDDTFLDMEPVIDNDIEGELPTDSEDKERSADDERTDGEESVKTPPAQAKPALVEVEGPDLFDGYSYKARNSVIMDDDHDIYDDHDENVSDEDAQDRDDAVSTAAPSLVENELEVQPVADAEGVKTPLAIVTPPPGFGSPQDVSTPTASSDKQLGDKLGDKLIDASKLAVPTPSKQQRTKSTTSSELDQELRDLVNDTVRLDDTLAEDAAKPKAVASAKPKPAEKPVAPAPTPAVSVNTTAPPRGNRKSRIERSGVAALDLGRDAADEESATEREDDDWDFIEKPGGEDINGQRGNSLFARGYVDRYRLAVFTRKQSPHPSSRPTPRSTSGISAAEPEATGSDSPTRRGRTTGLGLKTRVFLRPKSPPSTFSTGTSRSFSTAGTSVSSSGLLTPSTSMPVGQSLRSKPSTASVAHSSSSDQSGNGDTSRTSEPTSPRPELDVVGDTSLDAPDKPKKKLKKAADQVFALFSSPR